MPTGWHGVGVVSGNLLLSNAGMIIGPLKDRGELRGREEKTKDGYQIHFRLSQTQEPPEKWIYCGYGLGSDVKLLAAVDNATGQCVVKYKRKSAPSGPNILISCK